MVLEIVVEVLEVLGVRLGATVGVLVGVIDDETNMGSVDCVV